MTTTSRRPPPKAPGKRTRQRPADAAAPAAKGTKTAKGKGAKGTAAKSRPPKAAPKTAPARKSAPAKSTPASSTAASGSAAAKAAPARSTPAAGARRGASRRTQAPPRAPFVLLIVGLLGGALVSLLLLNTVLAKDAFTLTRLQQSTKQLEQQRQAYEAEIARESSPEGLSNKAKALGMKEAEDPAFFHSGSGRAGDGGIRPVPDAAAAAAGAAGVVGVPGTVVPGAGAP
ncbi:hypothetical protein [Actinomadura livida]|uniref:Cell division protein FtsL n=1 Tax=Actinomadura livida TaxID=79909 RepID=A0A7W7IG53_9ACTN|nr:MULTISPECIES: hypothetical protein [Actinomadura]MBB4776354.1 hypothetical protein [Actinomadura catellatispora]GGU32656.1 hypothetical protein GCM10010208_66650 [Actinomadura livida]